MEFSEYQRAAQRTDQQSDGSSALIVPLLGLAGETGTLLSSYKKFLRDGHAHRLFRNKIIEDLGDILWYLANVAQKLDVSLDEVAEANLTKIADRFGSFEPRPHRYIFDSGFPENERLPRNLEIVFEKKRSSGFDGLRVTSSGEQIGDILTDNAYAEDGYRYHDAFHFSYAALLGWSPVTRRILKRKRRSDPQIDHVEDGGRARVFEESIAALVFDRAKSHNFYLNVERIDYDILLTIRNLVANTEARVISSHDWEVTILESFRVWRALSANGGGTVRFDFENRTITVLKLTIN